MRICIPVQHIAEQTFTREGRGLLKDPRPLLPELKWWKSRGVDGIVLYDSPTYCPLLFMGGFEVADIPQGYLASLKAVFDEAGLEVPVINCLRKSLFVREHEAADEKRIYDILPVARIFETRIIDLSVNVPLPGQYYPSSQSTPEERDYPHGMFRGDFAPDSVYRGVAQKLKVYAKRLAEDGMELSLELHHDGLQDTADNCLKLRDMIDEPNVGFNPDLGNSHGLAIWFNPEGYLRTLEKLADRTNYFEIKNYKRIWIQSEKRYYNVRARIDDGEIDFRRALEMLSDAGFDGWISNEGAFSDEVRNNLDFIAYVRWVVDEWMPARGGFFGRQGGKT